MTQLDCSRKWGKKQKQIQKSKQISLLWIILICPRKGADSCETASDSLKCCHVLAKARGPDVSGRWTGPSSTFSQATSIASH